MLRHTALDPIDHMIGLWTWEVEAPEQRSTSGQAVVEYGHLLTSDVVGGPSYSTSDGRLEEIIANPKRRE